MKQFQSASLKMSCTVTANILLEKIICSTVKSNESENVFFEI